MCRWGREFQLLGEDTQKAWEAKDDLTQEGNSKIFHGLCLSYSGRINLGPESIQCNHDRPPSSVSCVSRVYGGQMAKIRFTVACKLIWVVRSWTLVYSFEECFTSASFYNSKLFCGIITKRVSAIEFSATKKLTLHFSLWGLRPHTPTTGALPLAPVGGLLSPKPSRLCP